MAKFTKHAWGVFKRGHDPRFKGRGALTLISTHKSELTAKQHAERSFPHRIVRRLSKEQRK